MTYTELCQYCASRSDEFDEWYLTQLQIARVMTIMDELGIDAVKEYKERWNTK